VIEGMTLRDWFAGQALSGMSFKYGSDYRSIKLLAEHCYCIADAMIEKEGKPDNILHSRIRDKLVRQLRELKELKEQTRS